MASASGHLGKVTFGSTEYGEAFHWTFNDQVDANQYAKFGSTKKVGVTGVGFGTGTIDVKYDFAVTLEGVAAAGGSVALKLYLSASRYISIAAAQITGVAHDVTAEGAAPVSATVSFQTNGDFSYV